MATPEPGQYNVEPAFVQHYLNQIAVLRQQVLVAAQQNETLTAQLNEANALVHQQEGRIRELEERIRAFREGKHHTVTWPTELARYLRGDGGLTYEQIVKLFCKESNMSTKYRYVHPTITFIKPVELGNEGSNLGKGAKASCLAATLAGKDMTGRFRHFERLPSNALRRIFEIWLYKPGCLVHCISALIRLSSRIRRSKNHLRLSLGWAGVQYKPSKAAEPSPAHSLGLPAVSISRSACVLFIKHICLLQLGRVWGFLQRNRPGTP